MGWYFVCALFMSWIFTILSLMLYPWVIHVPQLLERYHGGKVCHGVQHVDGTLAISQSYCAVSVDIMALDMTLGLPAIRESRALSAARTRNLRQDRKLNEILVHLETEYSSRTLKLAKDKNDAKCFLNDALKTKLPLRKVTAGNKSGKHKRGMSSLHMSLENFNNDLKSYKEQMKERRNTLTSAELPKIKIHQPVSKFERLDNNKLHMVDNRGERKLVPLSTDKLVANFPTYKRVMREAYQRISVENVNK